MVPDWLVPYITAKSVQELYCKKCYIPAGCSGCRCRRWRVSWRVSATHASTARFLCCWKKCATNSHNRNDQHCVTNNCKQWPTQTLCTVQDQRQCWCLPVAAHSCNRRKHQASFWQNSCKHTQSGECAHQFHMLRCIWTSQQVCNRILCIDL